MILYNLTDTSAGCFNQGIHGGMVSHQSIGIYGWDRYLKGRGIDRYCTIFLAIESQVLEDI